MHSSAVLVCMFTCSLGPELLSHAHIYNVRRGTTQCNTCTVQLHHLPLHVSTHELTFTSDPHSSTVIHGPVPTACRVLKCWSRSWSKFGAGFENQKPLDPQSCHPSPISILILFQRVKAQHVAPFGPLAGVTQGVQVRGYQNLKHRTMFIMKDSRWEEFWCLQPLNPTAACCAAWTLSG
jgi:hypothetical protein